MPVGGGGVVEMFILLSSFAMTEGIVMNIGRFLGIHIFD